MEWELKITYKLKPYALKAEVEYKSNNIMRIRVNGTKRTLLLENNYPAIRIANSKRGVNWKIREGSLDNPDERVTELFRDIIEQLEFLMKRDFKDMYPDLFPFS